METYNELLEEFRLAQESKEQLVNFKAISDDILSQMHRKKQTIKLKLMQLRKIRKLNQSTNASSLNMSALDISMLNSFQGSRIQQQASFEDKSVMIEIEKGSLDAQIQRLEKDINYLKEQNNNIVVEMQLIDSQEKKIKIAGHESERLVTEVHRQLAWHITNSSENQDKYHQYIEKIKLKKQILQTEIHDLIQQYEKTKNTRKKWKKTIFLQAKQSRNQQISEKQEKNPNYQKLSFQQNLRAFFLIQRMEACWNEQKEFICENQSKNLLSTAEIRLFGKNDLANYYEERGVYINEDLVTKISNFYSKLVNNFDRIERANNQISQSYRNLVKTDQELNKSIRKIFQKKSRNTMISLQKKEHNLKLMTQKLNNSCKIIFQFNIRFHELLKKITNFNKTFDKIVKSASESNRHLYRKTFVDVNRVFLNTFEMLLEKNPQDAMILWTKGIGSGEAAEKYIGMIMKNDLLRVHASPQMYSQNNSELQNEEQTFRMVFQYENDLIELLCERLKGLLAVPIGGIIHIENIKKQEKNLSKQKLVLLEDDFQRTFCVESKDYFRRDNYKLLEKIQRQQLKRKGLLDQIPFNVNTENQMNQEKGKRRDLAEFRAILSQRESMSNFKKEKFKYNALATKRENIGFRQKSMRKLLENLSNIATANQKYRISRKTHDVFHSSPFSSSINSFNSSRARVVL